MFVDAYYKRDGESEKVLVVERVNGFRIYKEYDPDYHFYISDQRGTHTSIYGTPLKKLTPRSFAEKQKMLKSLSNNVTTWESDVNPVIRCLEQNYKGVDSPKLNVAFIDIETSFDKESGWSDAADANNYITAISIHLQWLDEIICLSIPPSTIDINEANEIAERVGNTVLFDTEKEMLMTFLDLIEDADILSGWNSIFYDIPYIVNRIKKVLGKFETSRLCLWNQLPKSRSVDRGGRESPTYDLIGRVSLDYMELYKQYNYEERHSYALNAIAEIELNETKVDYDGTLDDLYHDDYEQFLQYNIQDTRLLDKLDKKLQFINLASDIAHMSCVLIPAVTGAVAVTDCNVLIEAHSKGLICPDKKHSKDEESHAAGGFVGTPKKGLHKWIASTDMKSLYPSVIRAFNMSPETIIGQIRLDRTNQAIMDYMEKGPKYSFAMWWNDRFNVLEMEDFYNQEIAGNLILDMEDGGSFNISGKELHDLIFNSGQPWCISANGTIFRQDIEGIIPSILSRWYSERKVLQKKAANINRINSGYELSEDILSLFKE